MGTKKKVVLRLLEENPTLSGGEIARLAGVSREYVRVLAEQAEGPGALRRRARLRAAKKVIEKHRNPPLRLSNLPEQVRRLLRRLRVKYFCGKPALAVLEDGTPVKFTKITRHETPHGTYLRILPPGLRSGIAVYYDDRGNWYALPASEAPRSVLYVKEGEPVPLRSTWRPQDAEKEAV